MKKQDRLTGSGVYQIALACFYWMPLGTGTQANYQEVGSHSVSVSNKLRIERKMKTSTKEKTFPLARMRREGILNVVARLGCTPLVHSHFSRLVFSVAFRCSSLILFALAFRDTRSA